MLQQSRDEYYTVDSLRTLFGTIPEACIIVSERSWILLSDMKGCISNTTLYSNQSPTDDIHRGETSINATEAKLLVFSASEGGSLLLRSQKVNMADKNDIDRLVFM